MLTGGKRLTELGPNYCADRARRRDVHDATELRGNLRPGRAAVPFRRRSRSIRAANDTPFGLASYFYSQDVRRIDRVSRGLEAGIVGINEGALASEAAPFGGVKESGYGREGSKYGLDDYLSIKYLCQGGLE